MNDCWDIIREIISEEQAHAITQRLSGCNVYIPSVPDKEAIIYAIKVDLKTMSYKAICKKYGLKELTVRRYEKWKIINNKLISPNGREYQLNKGDNNNGNT